MSSIVVTRNTAVRRKVPMVKPQQNRQGANAAPGIQKKEGLSEGLTGPRRQVVLRAIAKRLALVWVPPDAELASKISLAAGGSWHLYNKMYNAVCASEGPRTGWVTVWFLTPGGYRKFRYLSSEFVSNSMFDSEQEITDEFVQ